MPLLGGSIKNFLPVSDAKLQLQVAEEFFVSIGSKGEIKNLWLKGKVFCSSSKKLSNLEALLSNVHKILAFKKIAAKETNFITNRSIIFSSDQKTAELIEYDVDPSFISSPIKAYANYDINGDHLIIQLEVENCLDRSKIMGNAIRNIKLELCLSNNLKLISIEPIKEKDNIKYDRETSKFQWLVDSLDWSDKKRVIIKIRDDKGLLTKEIYDKQVKLSFNIPDRVLSQIFVDKVFFAGRVLRREIPFSFKCETVGRDCTVDIVPAFHKTSGFELLELTKEIAKEHEVLCGDEVKIVIKLRNCSGQRLRDVSLYDEVPGGIELSRGENYWMGYLNPNEAREIVYYIRPKVAGEYLLSGAKITFKDKEGRRYESLSNPCRLIVRALEKERKYQICGNCGAMLPLEASYCGKCGKRVK
ncbi:MAG: hypothetical protein QXF61_10370 [Nitrososphaeria archaeon]